MQPETDTPDTLEPPRTWPVLLSNLLAITFALLLMPLWLAGFADWDPCSKVAGCILGLPTAWLGLSAYRSGFRRYQPSAAWVGWAGLILAGLMTWCALVSFFAGFVMNHRRSLSTLGLCAAFLAVAAASLWCGLVNRQWAARLLAARRAAGLFHPPGWEMPRFNLRELLVATAVLAGLLGAARWHASALTPQFEEHAGRDSSPLHLPLDASDVSYFKFSRGGMVLEFSCSEPSFLEWLEEHESYLAARKAIRDPETITRYTSYLGPSGRPDRMVEIRRGWIYRETRGPDSFLNITYDAETGRAYYTHHSH